MRKGIFVLFVSFVILGCREAKKPVQDNLSESTEKLLSIDEICSIEDVIADSSYLEANGDTAWRSVNAQLVRVKIGKNSYLRRETKDGNITAFTYRYE